MRFSELASKEIINLTNGERLGPLGDTDLEIDPGSGLIHSILVPPRGRLMRQGRTTVIPWRVIRRIGPEVMIVDLDETAQPAEFGEN